MAEGSPGIGGFRRPRNRCVGINLANTCRDNEHGGRCLWGCGHGPGAQCSARLCALCMEGRDKGRMLGRTRRTGLAPSRDSSVGQVRDKEHVPMIRGLYLGTSIVCTHVGHGVLACWGLPLPLASTTASAHVHKAFAAPSIVSPLSPLSSLSLFPSPPSIQSHLSVLASQSLADRQRLPPTTCHVCHCPRPPTMTADNSDDMAAIVSMLRKLDAKQEQLSAQVRA